MMITTKKLIFPVMCICMTHAQAGIVKGKVIDAKTGETMIGASVTYAQGKGTITDLDGNFSLDIPDGQHTLTVRYMGYQTIIQKVTVSPRTTEITFTMQPDEAKLNTVTVTGEARHDTEASLLREQQQAHVTMTNISEQHIRRTQDKDAGEVIRRIPGVSIIDEKFVMVRGLSQRYNNVWMNGVAVPSSEADQRAFSFDLIPTSQISNMKVVKSAAPEYPADYTGGFIVINTKDVPQKRTWNISLSTGINDKTHAHDATQYHGSPTDFLGFDNGRRQLDGGLSATLVPQSESGGISLTQNDFDNDWTVKTQKPIPDLNLATDFSQRWHTPRNQTIGLTASLNYSNNNRTLTDVQNNMFGAYDQTHDRSNYLRQATDDQYSNNARLGAQLGLIWLSTDKAHRIELKQIFNQMGKKRYTYRRGYDAQSDYMEQAEYYYQSRSTYNASLQAKHNLTEADDLDWNLGYAYANRNLPDRRRYTVFGQPDGTLEVDNLNDINREFSYLGEHIVSSGANWSHHFTSGTLQPTLKAGLYAEHRRRRYDTRLFTYAWPSGQLPQNLRDLNVPTQLLTPGNYGPQGLYLIEQVDWSNNYQARNTLGSCYTSVLLPLFDNRFEIYGGVRFESWHTQLISHTRRAEPSPMSTLYTHNDFFPSVNLAYHLTPQHQFRLAYGRTTNRPEFRELSTSVYYDFDLASNVQGNHNLKPAYIDNVDLGWEWYPHAGEVISLSAFYKHFRDPIEWTYTVAGGTDLIYSYMNALGANNFGLELDIRKSLDFLHLPQFSLSVNAAWIQSRVTFPQDSRETDRPMQGQSPYLINAGLFFNSDLGHPDKKWQKGWTASLLYNTIGRRIIGVGRSVGTNETDVRVPDSYEMPRHLLDFNLCKSFRHFDIRLALRDILAQRVQFMQFEQTPNGEVQQTTRSFSPGRTITLSIAYKL